MYKRQDKAFQQRVASLVDARKSLSADIEKPFPTLPHKIVTVTIEENGDLTFLSTDSSDVFLEMGQTVKRRASHVEPEHVGKRIAFRILRGVFGDHGRIADWTRDWRGPWRVDTRPTAGVILEKRWETRQAAIDAEVKFLNNYFLERGIQ